MIAEEREPSRLSLAFTMLTALPRFGLWAEGVREFETPYGTIGYRQAAILWILRYELLPPNEMTPSGFACFHRVQPSVVTRALAKLEHAGFIERHTDPDDSRVSRISITSQGMAISVFIEQIYMDDLIAALAPVPDAEIEALRQSVETLNQVVVRLELLRLGRSARAPEKGSKTQAAQSGPIS
jgi:DNA-binding MarR family transcriptional regulator